ncbi:hypothetical protein H681_03880 [Pseudomonas sp. ATCC 13867]|uniref:hypothetical protein n=1 Tax=Pseudomonas sp. ATCC 13867 TaxID=1294143 RepID=UPI0002C4E218|nr:hypothetical protein [Pseudomonas sp. ATCC 13867]AGI22658.1 hypothetical protein H681_03880 [Pseudomonas sp. ATCC 13867]
MTRRKERPDTHFPYLPENPDITRGGEQFHAYPAKSFLGEQGVFAYYVIMLLGHEELSAFLALLQSRFSTTELLNESIVDNEYQESLALSYREEFGGYLVEATTNSISLLRSFDTLFTAPPAPWVVFPGMDPIEANLPKQGSLEYWWENIWVPFWTSRSESERELFLQTAPDDWREVL